MRGKVLLCTGGTGSLGQALVKHALALDPAKIIVFSRNEYDQFQMEQEFPGITYILGDICHLEGLIRAFKGVDYVIHAAALKHVAKCEKNPGEAMRVNIDGSRNVVRAAIECDVSKVLAVSTDKAVAPVNLYGATKLAADRYFLAASLYNHTQFAVVRFGNFADSRGSVGQLFRKLKAEGARIVPIRDKRMSRFHIELEAAAKFCFFVLEDCQGGEIYAPKMKSYRLLDLATALYPGGLLKEVGAMPGEKIHEQLILAEEGITYELPGYYLTIDGRYCQPCDSRLVMGNVTSEEADEWVTEFSQ